MEVMHMKFSKRLIALLLGVALVFGLAMPALAEGAMTEHSEAAANPAMPVITVQPRGLRTKDNEAFTLRVEATIPNGDEIGYQWCQIREQDGVASFHRRNAADLTITSLLKDYGGNCRHSYYYYVVVYNASQPELRVTSETVFVKVDHSFLCCLFDPLQYTGLAFMILAYIPGPFWILRFVSFMTVSYLLFVLSLLIIA